LEAFVCRFQRTPAEEDGGPHLSSLELPFMKKLGARNRGNSDRRSSRFFRRKGRKGARLIMVLDEADEFLLVAEISAQMEPDALGRVVLQPVVQALVIAVIESLLLELPLEVPIGLGDEKEVRVEFLYGGEHFNPILTRRPLTGAVAPGPFKNVVDEKHGHVTAHAVGLAGDIRKGLNYRLPEPRLKGV